MRTSKLIKDLQEWMRGEMVVVMEKMEKLEKELIND